MPLLPGKALILYFTWEVGGVSLPAPRQLEGEINSRYATPPMPNLAWIDVVTHVDSVCSHFGIKMSMQVLPVRPRKRQRTQSRTVTLMQLPRPVRAGVPKHSSARPRELKGIDTDLSSIATVQSSLTGNDDIVVLNLVQTGTGSFNRIGRKIFPQSVRITAFFRLIQATNTVVPTYLRWALVWDKQSSGGALPNYNEMFASTDQTGAEAATLWSPLRFDNTDRFRVLKEGRVGLSQSALATTGLGTDQLAIDEYVRLKGLETVYNATAGPLTIAEISSGALYFVCRCTDTTNTTVVLSGGNARLRYYD